MEKGYPQHNMQALLASKIRPVAMAIKLAILPPEFQVYWPAKIKEAVPDAEVKLFNSPGEAEGFIEEADCAYGFVTPELFARAKNLRWIQCYAAGPDPSFWHEALLKSDVTVTNFRGIFGGHVAHHAMAFVLSLSRRLPVYAKWQQEATWGTIQPVTYLPEATALIIGMGGIGEETARLCAAFGMTVIGIDPRIKDRPASVAELHPPEALDDVLPKADFVILAAPETPQTRRMIDARRLSLMKPSAFLVNVGRGACVVLDDLVAALTAKTISGAGLDVFDHEPLPPASPLWNMSNVVITPHIAARTVSPHMEERRTRLLVENCKRFANGEPLINVVDKSNWF
jgi:phosphoglycerate dehydrogenase-like enzyme